MDVRIDITMDNDAFRPQPGREVARILRRLAEECEQDGMPINDRSKLFDNNGNTVGHFATFEEPADKDDR